MAVIRVGIDAKPLTSPRAGVARYLDGLLAGLAALHTPDLEVELLRPSRRRRTLPWVLWDLQRATSHGLDVLHCPFYYPPLAPRCPATVVVHDVLFLEHPEWFPQGRLNPLRALVPRGARRAAAVVVSTAHNAAVIAARCGLRPGRTRVIPWGVDHTLFRPAEADRVSATRERLGLRAPFLLQVGAIEPRRGVDLAVEAARAARRRDVRLELVLVGDVRAATPGLAALPAWVRRLGRVADEDLAALYGAAEAVLAPSRGEGFDLPVLEALACGAAVVASDIPVHVELFAPAVALFRSGDAGALGTAVEGVLADPDRRAAVRGAATALARGFSWPEAARRHVEMWREVAR